MLLPRRIAHAIVELCPLDLHVHHQVLKVRHRELEGPILLHQQARLSHRLSQDMTHILHGEATLLQHPLKGLGANDPVCVDVVEEGLGASLELMAVEELRITKVQTHRESHLDACHVGLVRSLKDPQQEPEGDDDDERPHHPDVDLSKLTHDCLIIGLRRCRVHDVSKPPRLQGQKGHTCVERFCVLHHSPVDQRVERVHHPTRPIDHEGEV
mmetsp:Transcript_24077/g.59399  ORF Transcript_24077/g.59399 Transcript_24077/m.59399 type:complete len:212 (-) Transcript_24077:962-1597(-)